MNGFPLQSKLPYHLLQPASVTVGGPDAWLIAEVWHDSQRKWCYKQYFRTLM
jgi:hypothetical protein